MNFMLQWVKAVIWIVSLCVQSDPSSHRLKRHRDNQVMKVAIKSRVWELLLLPLLPLSLSKTNNSPIVTDELLPLQLRFQEVPNSTLGFESDYCVEVSWGFPHSFRAKSGAKPWNGPWQLRPACFPIHYSQSPTNSAWRYVPERPKNDRKD
jgi:hypothetical protein